MYPWFEYLGCISIAFFAYVCSHHSVATLESQRVELPCMCFSGGFFFFFSRASLSRLVTEPGYLCTISNSSQTHSKSFRRFWMQVAVHKYQWTIPCCSQTSPWMDSWILNFILVMTEYHDLGCIKSLAILCSCYFQRNQIDGLCSYVVWRLILSIIDMEATCSATASSHAKLMLQAIIQHAPSSPWILNSSSCGSLMSSRLLPVNIRPLPNIKMLHKSRFIKLNPNSFQYPVHA